MQIEEFDTSIIPLILEKLRHENIQFGGNEFESLLSPCVVGIDSDDELSIGRDFRVLWELYETWNGLYSELKNKDNNHWLVRFSRSGLSMDEVGFQDQFNELGLSPRYGRIDYISLEPTRKVAEVQWRSGGPGLLVGMSEVISSVVINESGLDYGTFELSSEFAKVFHNPNFSVSKNKDVIVNDVSGGLYPAEEYFRDTIQSTGCQYIPVVREVLSEVLSISDGVLCCKVGAKQLPISFIHGYNFYQYLDNKILKTLLRQALDGSIWIESPLNFIFRQKWGFALPFLKEFENLFDDNLREILCPTVLLNLARPNYEALAQGFSVDLRPRFSNIRSIQDVISLPRSVRSDLVLKCGSGEGHYHTKSRGVFRLSGTEKHVEKIFMMVHKRMNEMDEPWILQPYVNVKTPISFYSPKNLNDHFRLDAHSRYLVFGSRLDGVGSEKVIGGLGNFGKYWKVNGRSNSKNDDIRLWGASFVPIVRM